MNDNDYKYLNPEDLTESDIAKLKPNWRLIVEGENLLDEKFQAHLAVYYIQPGYWEYGRTHYAGCGDWTYATDVPICTCGFDTEGYREFNDNEIVQDGDEKSYNKQPRNWGRSVSSVGWSADSFENFVFRTKRHKKFCPTDIKEWVDNDLNQDHATQIKTADLTTLTAKKEVYEAIKEELRKAFKITRTGYIDRETAFAAIDRAVAPKPLYRTVGDNGKIQLWSCRRCGQSVTRSEDGHGICGCKISPSPWELKN